MTALNQILLKGQPAKTDDSVSLCSIYDTMCGTLIQEIDLTNTPEDDDETVNIFSAVQEINVSIQTDTSIGVMKYKAAVLPDSPRNELIGEVLGEDNMLVKVTKLPTSEKSLNVTIYQGGDVVDTFVTNISFFDRDEGELNIIKQELVG